MKVKKFKKIISLGMAVILAGTVLTGCKIKSDTPILGKIFGLGGNQIFKVNELVCSKIEYKLVFMDYVNKYKKDFGGDIDWNAKINNDLTMKEYIMDKAKEDISVKYTISSMAEEKNVRLDKDDMAEVVDLSNEYYNKLSQDEKDFTEATLDDVQAVYCNYELADKVYEKVTEDVGNDISEEDARVIKIQYIRMRTDNNTVAEIKSKLNKIAKKVTDEKQDFSKEAKQVSEDDSVEKVLKKNEAKQKFETESFKVNPGQVSKIINDGKNYYLIYCVDNYDKTATATNKAEIIKEAKDQYFAKEYNKYVKSVSKDINTSAWNKIEPEDTKDMKTCNLIELYNNR